MKKILLSAVFIAASFTTFAQVGIGTTDPKGALQVTSTTSGVIIPQFADLTAIQAITKADGTTALDTEEQGMQVYNIAEKKNYLWDGTAWVSANGSAGKFVDDAYGNTVLDMSTAVDSIKYTMSGYKSFPNNVTTVEDFDTSTSIPGSSALTVEDLNANDVKIKLSSNMPVSGTTGSFNNTKYGDFNYLIVDQLDNTTSTITKSGARVVVPSTNSNSYNNIYGMSDAVLHNGTGEISTSYGDIVSVMSSPNGKINNIWARYANAANYYTGHTNRMTGMISRPTLRSNGSISRVTGVYGTVANSGAVSGTATRVESFASNIAFDANFTGSITNTYDYYAESTNEGNGSIGTKYGLYILGTDKNNHLAGKLAVGRNTKAQADVYVQSSSNINQAASLGLFRYYLDDSETRGSTMYHTYDGTQDMLVIGMSGTNSTTKVTPVNDLAQAKLVITDSNKIGVNNVAPEAILDVNGAIKVGEVISTPKAGMIQYGDPNGTGVGFFGYNGTAWVALDI